MKINDLNEKFEDFEKENIGVENASDEAIREALSHIISFDNLKVTIIQNSFYMP